MSNTIHHTTPVSDPPLHRVSARGVVPYEKQLSNDSEWALSEGSLFFEGRGRVQESLARIAKRLDELAIPYAIAGGMALFLHGYRRFTEDVDILVTREGLHRIHQELAGLGYLRPFEKSKNLRDTESGVKIEFLVSGGFPGDGKPKSIVFPDPSAVAEIKNNIRVLNLPQVISLKIASGMTGEGRSKDLADVEELIKLLNLPQSLSDSLHPFSRDKYIEIWRQLHVTTKRYLLLWRNKWLATGAQSIDDMIQALGNAAEELKAMRDDGVILDPEGGTPDDYARLVTNDRVIAEKYGMEDESEFWDLDEEEPSGDSGEDQEP